MEKLKTLVCFGDSNTNGVLPVHSLSSRLKRASFGDRWPGVTSEILGSGWNVVEEGLPGRTTVFPDPVEGDYKSGISYLQAMMETHWPVDWVVIMLGTNDLKARFALQPMDIALGAATLVKAVKRVEYGRDGVAPRVCLVCPTPIKEAGCLAPIFLGGEAKSHQLWDSFQQASESLECELINIGDYVQVSPIDGVHFEAKSQRTIGEVLASKLEECDRAS
ncbi:MAG: SGNH/GDSL hydrolase family protein [Pseudomonadota bacterium]